MAASCTSKCVRALGLLLCVTAAAQTPEQRTVRAFDEARKSPLTLRVFLQPLPKGGDLHVHLGSGSSYAETIIQDGVEDGLCIVTATLSFTKKNSGNECGPGTVPAAKALTDQVLYDALVDSISMRNFVPTPGFSGHDQFFATFDKVNSVSNSHLGEWADEMATRAGEQNEQYIEAMVTPPFGHAAKLGYQIGWLGDTPEAMRTMREKLLAAGLRDEVAADRKLYETTDASRSARERCGTPAETAGCGVKMLYLYQILRGYPPQQVFAQTLLGFEVASAEMESKAPRVVGINFVMPEDSYLSMRDYHLQMVMIDTLHALYPKVRLTLHAGELAPGLVPPHGLQFHIREAIDLGHAERIGHGVDVMYENDAPALLKEMAAKHVMVEVNLTSNDVILGIKGAEHPLASYRAAHVPWALSTDDEGVSRIDLTHEYEKGVLEQGLGYLDLKQSARNSLEHSFIPGESLWAAPDQYTRRKAACAAAILPKSEPTAACAALLKTSDRAAQQWELERRFAAFEAAH
jgi:adenosine deaminase